MNSEYSTEIFEECVDDCSYCKYLSDCAPDYKACLIDEE